ncbi:MAG: hypothetical protein R3A52_23250 [Polyangiales bacterium]
MPVTARRCFSRGGAWLAGQRCNAAVVIDWSRHLHRVIEVDLGEIVRARGARHGARHARDAAERHHLTFGPRPGDARTAPSAG